ncbi:unnamed protein product [Protopolystoma xenopodis]|uniref:Uncharacterized protein n=1 Tax=Protopolystoma xenopodis TaxID=117903 RepID=A0A3S5BZK6_9PLAT|nr:unnamed protein product [Protopolystoma xenopodis]
MLNNHHSSTVSSSSAWCATGSLHSAIIPSYTSSRSASQAAAQASGTGPKKRVLTNSAIPESGVAEGGSSEGLGSAVRCKEEGVTSGAGSSDAETQLFFATDITKCIFPLKKKFNCIIWC